jgi:hypothetical protein
MTALRPLLFPWAALLLAALSTAILPVPATAIGSDWRLGGYLKSLDLYLAAPPADPRGSGAVSSNRLRLDLTGPVTKKVDLEVSLEDQLLFSDPAGYQPLSGNAVNRVFDLDHAWHDGSAADRLDVDRIALSGTLFGAQWRLGRQALGFGRIALFSPLDIIAPFPPDALDTDVRPGVDALHLVRYFGLGGQLGGTAIFGDVPRHNSYLATFSENVAQIDVLAIGGELRHRPVLGLGLAGSLGPLGLKGEITGYRGTNASRPGGDLHRHFAIAAIETWYRFEAGPILLVGYLHNGAGADQPSGYPAAYASAALQEGLNFLAGRHYLLLGPSWEIHPLVKLDALVIANLADSSFLLRPLIDLSLSDNATLQLFYTYSYGRAPRVQPPLPVAVPHSEFGSAGDSGGLFLKYFY